MRRQFFHCQLDRSLLCSRFFCRSHGSFYICNTAAHLNKHDKRHRKFIGISRFILIKCIYSYCRSLACRICCNKRCTATIHF